MNQRKVLTLLVALALALAVVLPGALPAQAAAPANDDFDNALVIPSLPFSNIQETTEATAAGDDPAWWCWGNPVNTIWYTYTTDEVKNIHLDTAGANYPTAIGVFTGMRGSLNQVACNSGYPTNLDIRVQPGTYYIMITNIAWYPYPDPNLQLTSGFNINEIPAPANDNFADAMVVTALPFTHDVNITAATNEIGEPISDCEFYGGYSASQTAWYAYTPSESGFLTANSWGGIYAFWAVWTGFDLTSLHEVACMPWGGRYPFQVNAGTTYYIQVGSTFDQGSWITLQLLVAPLPSADFYYTPGDPSIFDTVDFWDSSSDPGGAGFEWFEWNFGDGTTATGNPVQHRYLADGDYLVSHLVTTWDGRTAWVQKTVPVRTHDVAITKLTVPKSARAGQTRTITVGIKNLRYGETVMVDLWKSTSYGYEGVGSLTNWVPVRPSNRTTDFLFSYTFTKEDARIGKVTFWAVATIQGARDALPSDNEAISLRLKVGR